MNIRHIIKKMVLVGFMFFAASYAVAGDLVAPIYPGATAFSKDKPGCYLSKDSYEKIRNFYKKKSSGVTRERVHGDMTRMAFFEYMSVAEVQKYDSVGSAIGVRIVEKPNSQTAAAEVLGTLKVMTAHGMLDNEEYKRLEKLYKPVVVWFFPRDDKTGRPLDEVIYERYEQAPAEQQVQQETREIAEKAQELIMQGRHEEGLKLMQQAGTKVEKLHGNYGTGQAGVKKWKKCLAEMKNRGFRTRIEIALHP